MVHIFISFCRLYIRSRLNICIRYCKVAIHTESSLLIVWKIEFLKKVLFSRILGLRKIWITPSKLFITSTSYSSFDSGEFALSDTVIKKVSKILTKIDILRWGGALRKKKTHSMIFHLSKLSDNYIKRTISIIKMYNFQLINI